MASPARVLVVEDQDLIQDLLAEILVDGGFSVAVASDSGSALAALDQYGANYSALIVDVMLPGGFSGWDVARRAREINPTLPVVYVTGGDPAGWSSKGVPGSQILAKPFAMSQVLTAVTVLVNAAATPIRH